MSVLLTKSEFQQKWDSMLMSSSEFWWYAGSKDNIHFIAIETPLNTNIYQVKNSIIKIVGIKKMDYSPNKQHWITIKTQNIEILN